MKSGGKLSIEIRIARYVDLQTVYSVRSAVMVLLARVTLDIMVDS